MEGLRAWNDPPLKTVHNYIDLFRQILEGMAFLHEKHISLGPGTFASPAQLGLMVDIGYCAMSVVASPYPSGRQSQGDGASSSTSASASASRSVERGLTSTRGSTSTPAERRRGSRSPGRHGIGHAMDLRPLTRINGSPPTRSVVSPPAGLTSNPPLPSGLGSNPPLPSGLASNLGKSVGMSKAASASTASFDRTLYPVKYYFTNLAKAVQLDAAPPPAEGESVSENGNESGKVKAKGGMKGDVVDCAGLFETLLGEVPKIAPKLRTLVKAMKSGGFGAEDARKLFEAMVSSLEAGVFESSAGGGVE
ncbi:hypothetical protein BDV98DRAFT_360005 [Pterulicium gracile]|uniref:Protein kinase domain-containing protein n=1 Tax=Pterulicium gracile TaxID=1884261 RepID=A0A5C3QU60_9AGAR|nr:hypothetical protein BDV98DRAFT_360005 [Pterula gracilis]